MIDAQLFMIAVAHDFKAERLNDGSIIVKSDQANMLPMLREVADRVASELRGDVFNTDPDRSAQIDLTSDEQCALGIAAAALLNTEMHEVAQSILALLKRAGADLTRNKSGH